MSLKIYFAKLKIILQAQIGVYFALSLLSLIYILWITSQSFFTFLTHKVAIDWVLMGLFALFMLTFILQSLLLQKKCYPLFLCRVLIVFLIGCQFARPLYKLMYIRMHEGGEAYAGPDEVLGSRLRPNLQNAKHWQILGKDTLYNICFSSDQFSRRIPDDGFMKTHPMNEHHPDKHALFFGCSFTFGQGIMYSSTFPYLFEASNPHYKSYNYGAGGYGPHQIALLFDKRVNTVNSESVKEPDGFALYTFIDDHLNRVYGSSIYLRWSPPTPLNVHVENDSLIVEEWPEKQLMKASFLNDMALLRFFDYAFYAPDTEDFYKRFADIINYTAKKYWKVKPGGRFYVGIYPGYSVFLNWTKYLNEKIIVLNVDAPADFAENPNKYMLYNDGHPSHNINVYYVNEITKQMQKYESGLGPLAPLEGE